MRRKPRPYLILWAAALLAAALPAPAAQAPGDEALVKKIDEVMTEVYKPGQPGAAIIVRKDGRTGLRIQPRIGPARVYGKTSKPLPSPRKAAAVAPEVLDQYVGDYEIAPGFVITILRLGDRLISRATGQPEVELVPESETRFFLREVDAQVDFVKDASGRVTGLVVHQGGQDLPGKKIRTP